MKDTVVRRLIKNLLFPTLKALLYHHQMVRRLIKNRLFQTLIPFLDLLQIVKMLTKHQSVILYNHQVLNKKTNPTDHFCFVEFFKVDSAGTC
ncbi:uncharacterized protein LOC117111326 isoform X4 [Anneissia japonica]|uniref:uncharacterized protein LOC117111326 isoform X4 n=1 Tax=Anneissia japonica TaxID=1529436 RepID=UPI001425AD99|nr:uncharacterized protein LOC117111326 isoform X4 [Anneissia japonica]